MDKVSEDAQELPVCPECKQILAYGIPHSCWKTGLVYIPVKDE